MRCVVAARLTLLFVCLCCVLTNSSSRDASLSLTQTEASPLSAQIYTRLNNVHYCVRLLHKSGSVGCATPQTGLRGQVLSIANDAQWHALMSPNSSSNSNSERWLALVMPSRLVNGTTLRALQARGRIAGVMILAFDSPGGGRPGAQSVASRAPQRSPFDSTSATATATTASLKRATQQQLIVTANRLTYPQLATPEYDSMSRFMNQTFEWNPPGDASFYTRYDFALLQLSLHESEFVLQNAVENQRLVGVSSSSNAAAAQHQIDAQLTSRRRALYYAEFHYEMWSRGTSFECLDDTTCQPSGGYSIWSALGNLTNQSTSTTTTSTTDSDSSQQQQQQQQSLLQKDYVLGVTHFDAMAQFQSTSTGADAAQSGVIALMVAAQVLANLFDITQLRRQILILLFTGESLQQMGSRRFVADLQEFECLQVHSTNPSLCIDPWQMNMNFTRLNMSRVVSLLELNQIGLMNSSDGNSINTLYAHTERDSNMRRSEFVASLQSLASNHSLNTDTALRVELPSDDTPGVPPSSAMSFLAANSSIAAIVLTDHRREYVNTQYASSADDNTLLTTSSNSGNGNGDPNVNLELRISQLCAIASLTARALYVEAGGNLTLHPVQAFQANCTLIRRLYDCLIIDKLCLELQPYWHLNNNNNAASDVNFDPTHYPHVVDQRAPQHYTTVFQYVRDVSTVLPQTAWLATELARLTQNATNGAAASPNANTFYHDAYSLGLKFDLQANRWRIMDTSASELWTESNWPIESKLGVRLYRQEAETVQIGILMSGLVVFVVSVVLMRHWTQHKQKRT